MSNDKTTSLGNITLTDAQLDEFNRLRKAREAQPPISNRTHAGRLVRWRNMPERCHRRVMCYADARRWDSSLDLAQYVVYMCLDGTVAFVSHIDLELED